MADDNKTDLMRFRVTEAEKTAILNASEAKGVPMSELVRSATLKEVNKINK
jgi:hypothetical protein